MALRARLSGHFIVLIAAMSAVFGHFAQSTERPHNTSVQKTCIAELDPYGNPDELEKLESYEPWTNVLPGARLSEYTLRMVRHDYNAQLQNDFLRQGIEMLLEMGTEIMVRDFRTEDFKLDPNIRSARLPNSYFLTTIDKSQELIRPASPSDLETLEQSNVQGIPHEAFRFHLHEKSNKETLSNIDKADSRGFISGASVVRHFEAEFGDFEPAAFRQDRFLGFRYGKRGYVEFIHSHPVFSYLLVFLSEGKAISETPVHMSLSGPDKDTCRKWSVENKDVPFMMTAVAANGYKYSALFLNGEDITKDIEKYLK